MTKTVAYQGTKGAFSEMAIERFLGSDCVSIGKVSFQDVFDSLECGEVSLCALPIENSLIGPIFENFDLFDRYNVEIVGETSLRIEHCLVGKKQQKIAEVRRVISHPKALAQCTEFFKKHPWIEPMVHFDTAGAAQDIALRNDLTLAAIGSRKTAELYQLDILQENLEDDKSNMTRFLFLQKGGNKSERKSGKCSLLFTLKHMPGALAEVLQVLAQHRLNLMQIVSRPIREKPFEYLFFVDFLFSEKVDLKTVMDTLKEKTHTLRELGCYEPAQ